MNKSADQTLHKDACLFSTVFVPEQLVANHRDPVRLVLLGLRLQVALSLLDLGILVLNAWDQRGEVFKDTYPLLVRTYLAAGLLAIP